MLGGSFGVLVWVLLTYFFLDFLFGEAEEAYCLIKRLFCFPFFSSIY